MSLLYNVATPILGVACLIWFTWCVLLLQHYGGITKRRTGKWNEKWNRKGIGWRLDCDMSFKIIYLLLKSLKQNVQQNCTFLSVCNKIICFTFGEHFFNASIMLGSTLQSDTQWTHNYIKVCVDFSSASVTNKSYLEPMTRHCRLTKQKLSESVSLGKKGKNH